MSLRFSLALLLMVAMSQLLEQVEAGKKKFCGDALNEALDLICATGFSRRLRRDTDRSPRSPELALLRKWRILALQPQLDQLVLDEGDDMELINESHKDDEDGELRRPRRRITYECCVQGCTYDDIGRYCA